MQKSVNDVDLQLSYFNRYSSLHFVPDIVGDLLFNGIASDVYRATFANGVQGDGSYKVNDAHTLRTGFSVTSEKTQNTNLSTVEPCMLCDGTDNVDAPFTVNDSIAKLGWLYAVYVQDEWKITNQLTLNAGLRFDQMDEYVSANQLSPRLSVVYQPLPGTTFHAGYARYFTPPPQTIAAPVNIAAFANTTAQPSLFLQDPVLPERANVYDAGVTQVVSRGCAPLPSSTFTKAPPRPSADCERLELGLDAYYKTARDLLDDGQFGAALVLSGFNYEKAYNEGVEASVKYRNGPFQAYGNVAWGIQKATESRLQPISVRQRHAACRSWRPDRIPIPPITLHLHRSHPDMDGVGRRLLPLVGDPVHRGHDLWQRAARRRREYQHRPRLYPGQRRRVARVRGLHHDAVHLALRRGERLRLRLYDPGRFGHRRVRAAIRAAPRLLRRMVVEAVMAHAAGRCVVRQLLADSAIASEGWKPAAAIHRGVEAGSQQS